MDLERKSIEFPDDEDGRIYYDSDGNIRPSVTTITSRRNNPGKDKAIKFWKRKYDGEHGKPYWKHIYEYSGPRGTWIHWYIQTHLVEEDLAGDEEHEAKQWVKDHDRHYGYVSSIAKKHTGTISLPDKREYHLAFEDDDEPNPVTLTEILARDSTWALTEFAKKCDVLGLADTGYADSECESLQSYFDTEVYKDRVLDTETYVYGDDPAYAGQFDLLYERPNGDVMLSDLKTSSQVSYEYKMQLAAYANAINRTVDELEVIRLQPDKEDVEISRESEWDEQRSTLYSEFCDICEDVVELVEQLDDNVTDDSYSD